MPKTKKLTSPKSSFTKRVSHYFKTLQPRQWVGLLLLATIACGLSWIFISQSISANTDTNKLQVTATFYPLYDFAKQVGGDLVDVTNSTPAGAEAHDYEPSPQNLVAAMQADLFIYNDPNMEPWTEKFLTDYKGQVVKTVDAVKNTHHSEEDHQEDEDRKHGHDHANDPHSWTDPLLAQSIVQAIAEGYKKADPHNASTYQANADTYKAQLAQLDQDFSQGLAKCQRPTIITSHSAFSYLAERYNIAVLPISGLSPEQEPSVAKLAELTKLVKQYQIKYIFFESQTSPQLAQALARETNTQTLVLNPIESLAQSALDTNQNYLTVQRSNLAHLRLALACQ